MSPLHFAHSGKQSDRSDWQKLPDHLAQTADRAAKNGERIGLSNSARLAGELHDFGKYDPAFQQRLAGDPTRVDHSTAGGHLLIERGKGVLRPFAEVLAYAILGHHAGLPDATGTAAAMEDRLDAFAANNPVAPEIAAATAFDLKPVKRELLARIRPEQHQFDLSVAGRMLFSCLVDADFRDTEAYYDQLDGRRSDREWPALADLLPSLRAAFESAVGGFSGGGLNALRAEILAHIRAGAELKPGLFTLTVPTGGGKTLASLGFALDHAARYGHRRIVYAIPYTSIIDQTAATFRNVFAGLGEVVLEHHASIDEASDGQQGRDKARLAMEDWAAPIVVTTNVQLFESLFAARPSRCRKLHNIAGSIIILDEAQCLPRQLLMPVLRMLDTLAALYGCTVVLCTATQPAFDSAQLHPGGLPLAGRELARDPQGLARRLRRARIVDGGAMEDAALIEALVAARQGMVIVNSRRHALDLFEAATTAGLEGLVHLTTRQYPAHRRRILDDIRASLRAGAPCRLIATSLIEAGVDVDFPKGWRADAGLDSIVQSAGRVNREGRHPVEDSTLTIFRAPQHPPHRQIEKLVQATASTLTRFAPADLLDTAAITDWFNQVYWSRGTQNMGQPMVSAFTFGVTGTNFPYRSTAEAFRMIEDTMLPVIIATCAKARTEVARLTIPDIPSGALARALQQYMVQIPTRARDLLIANGHARYHATEHRGDQFCVLENTCLYRADVGLWWERADYLTADTSII